MRGEREEEVRGGGGGGGGLRGERVMTLSMEDSVKEDGGDEEEDDEDWLNCGSRRIDCGDDDCTPSSASFSSWFQIIRLLSFIRK